MDFGKLRELFEISKIINIESVMYVKRLEP